MADISLLEVSLLLEKSRISAHVFTAVFLERRIVGIEVLPLTVEIAAGAARPSLPQAELFDCLIVSTAIEHQLVLIARDRAITASGLVGTLW